MTDSSTSKVETSIFEKFIKFAPVDLLLLICLPRIIWLDMRREFEFQMGKR